MLKAKLVVVGGDAKAAEISLSLPTTIGRGRDANLTLPHPLVSRQHCELFEQEGMLHVRDLQSLNGTYVDSQRIETSSILMPDQLLTIGNVTFRAIYSSKDESVAEPDSNVSNVIEFNDIQASGDTDSQIEADRKQALHNRPTVRGDKKPNSPKRTASSDDILQTVHAPDVAGEFAGNSNVLPELGPAESSATPQHSIVEALRQAGVSENQRVDATLSEIQTQLPNKSRPQASSIDGLAVDPSEAPADKADFSGIEADEKPSTSVESDESALDSFIRKLPR